MTNTIPSSPWHNLKPLYILPEDFAAIAHHPNFPNLVLDTVPGQIIGGLNTAEVVFLLLNPGFDPRDTDTNLMLPDFLEANRLNHDDPYNSPFYYFNDGLETTSGHEWWAKILKPLLNSGVTKAVLSSNIMAIEYFPYHSRTYKSLPIMPSQQFAFNLVTEAIKRQKTIVIMRSKSLWYEAVPELEGYSNKMIIKNPRSPYISPKNLGEANFNLLATKLMPL